MINFLLTILFICWVVVPLVALTIWYVTTHDAPEPDDMDELEWGALWLATAEAEDEKICALEIEWGRENMPDVKMCRCNEDDRYACAQNI